MTGRSKTLATWLAFLFGGLGAHRFYLYGVRDALGWLHLPFTALGVYGVLRMRELGQDDRLAWILIPVLGIVLAQSMLTAIVYGLRPDAQWNARFNPQGEGRPSGWPVVFGVIGALTVGSVVLISTLAFGIQRYFESQVEAAQEISQ